MAEERIRYDPERRKPDAQDAALLPFCYRSVTSLAPIKLVLHAQGLSTNGTGGGSLAQQSAESPGSM